MHQSQKMQMKDAGWLGADHTADGTIHLKLAAEGIPMSKDGQGISEMIAVVTWISAPPGLITLPTVQEVTFRDLEALVMEDLYLTELGGALRSMKNH